MRALHVLCNHIVCDLSIALPEATYLLGEMQGDSLVPAVHVATSLASQSASTALATRD